MSIQKIQVECDELIANSFPATQLPGARFIALARDGSTIYSNPFGLTSKGGDKLISEETMYWLASATKVLTAISAIKCVDLGLIKLDDNVLPYLPDLEKQRVRHGFMTPEFKLVPRQGNITLRQLLSLTSGTSYPVTEFSKEVMMTMPTGSGPFMTGDKSAYVGPLECQPGDRWSYSGAFDWAGELVEKLSGLSLGDFMQKYIIAPCGINSSDFTFALKPKQSARLMGSHFRWPDGKVTPRGQILANDPKVHLGGSGAYATAEAYSQALLPLINNGRHPKTGAQILKPELVKEMFRPQLNEQQRAWLDRPTMANANEVLYPEIEKQWGLGFMLFPKGSPSGRGHGSGSWAGFANTHWYADPAKGVLMVVFSQVIPQEDKRLLALRDEVEKIIYDNLPTSRN